jgi:DNA modification methylase
MMPFFKTQNGELYSGDVRDILPRLKDKSIQMCVTSPPYWNLRDYGVDGQIGLEDSPQAYIENMAAIFDFLKDVLSDDGTCWVNISDTYYGGGRGCTDKNTAKVPPSKKVSSLKAKDLCLVPQRLAIALQQSGWYIRNDIIWHKPNCMPESVTDRCTKAHEYIFLMSKTSRYYFDCDAIAEPLAESTANDNRTKRGQFTSKRPQRDFPTYASQGSGMLKSRIDGKRNKRSVWNVSTRAFKDAHFATFPEKLIEPCILAGSRRGDVVLDPFMGSGTTAAVCERLGRRWIGIELNEKYCQIAAKRIKEQISKYALFSKKDNL